MAAEMEGYQTITDTRIVSTSYSDDEDELELLREAALRTMADKKTSERITVLEFNSKDEIFVEQEDSLSSASTEYEEISLNSPPASENMNEDVVTYAESSNGVSDDDVALSTKWTYDTQNANREKCDQIESLTITVENEEENSEDDDSDAGEVDDDVAEAVTTYENGSGDVSVRESGEEENVESLPEVVVYEDDQEVTEEDYVSEEEILMPSNRENHEKMDGDDDEEGNDDGNSSGEDDNQDDIFETQELEDNSSCGVSEEEEVTEINQNEICHEKPNNIENRAVVGHSINSEAQNESTAKKQAVKATKDIKDNQNHLTKINKSLAVGSKDSPTNGLKLPNDLAIDSDKKSEKQSGNLPDSSKLMLRKAKEEELHTDQLSIGGSSSESCDEFDEEVRSKGLRSTVEQRKTPSADNKQSKTRLSSSRNRSRSRSRTIDSYTTRDRVNERNLNTQRNRDFSRVCRSPYRLDVRSRRNRSPARRSRSPARRSRSPARRSRSPARRSRSPARSRSLPRRSRSPVRRNQNLTRRNRSPFRSNRPIRKSRDLRGRSLTPKRSKSPTVRKKRVRSPIQKRRSRNRSPALIRRSKSPPKKKGNFRKSLSPSEGRKRKAVSRSRSKETEKATVKSTIKSRLGATNNSRSTGSRPRTKSPPFTQSPPKARSPLQQSVKLNLEPEKRNQDKRKVETNIDSIDSKPLVLKKRTLIEKSDARNLLSTKKPLQSKKLAVKVGSKQKKINSKAEKKIVKEPETARVEDKGDLRRIIQKTDEEPLSAQDSKERDLDARIAKIRQRNMDILKRNLEIQKEKELFG